MSDDRRRRAVLLTLVVAVLVGAGTVDAVVARTRPPAPVLASASAVRTGRDASSSAWYCAAAAATPAGSQASVILTNPGPRAVTGSLEAHSPSGGGTQGRGFAVPARGQLSVPVSGAAAAQVLLQGGGVGVLEVVSGPFGVSSAPCVSTTAAQWYFGSGSTAPGHAMSLVLFNPTSSDAVVDVTFVSATSGVVAPPAYQGLPVAAGSAVVENVSDHLQKDPSFATEVVALSGTVVAAEATEASGGADTGLSFVAGSEQPHRQWTFAQNVDAGGSDNVFSILNPSDRAAKVTVSIGLGQGQAAPLVMEVPASSLASLPTTGQTRIPRGATFALTFTSSGPGIVVARRTSLAPGAVPDVGTAVGVAGGQRRWLVPSVPSPFVLTVANVAGRLVHVTLSGYGPGGATVAVPGAARLPLAASAIMQLGPGPALPLGPSPVEVSADGPVALELDLQAAGTPGTSVVPAWPLLPPGD